MRKGNEVEYIGINKALQGNRFIISKVNTILGLIKLKEVASWHDWNDFKVINKNKRINMGYREDQYQLGKEKKLNDQIQKDFDEAKADRKKKVLFWVADSPEGYVSAVQDITVYEIKDDDAKIILELEDISDNPLEPVILDKLEKAGFKNIELKRL